MPTPNEREIYLGSWCRTKAGSAALADLIAQYRESIIASEREAAADRWELLIYWAFPWGKYTLAELRVRASEEQLKEIAEGRAAILDGRSASPKESSEPLTQMCDLGAGGIVEVPTLAGIKAKQTERGYVNKQGVWIDEPATPLQEAQDRGDTDPMLSLEYQSIRSDYVEMRTRAERLREALVRIRDGSLGDGFIVSATKLADIARAALAAEGKA
jgi:hypothetical protein